MTTHVYFWLIVALMFLLFEMGHPGLLLFLSFSFGALMSALSSYYSYGFIGQTLTFLGGTLVSLFILRRWLASKWLATKTYMHTNVYALQGKHGMVTKSIKPDIFGQVKIGGELWSARSVHNTAIEKDTHVKVIDVRGSHVVVENIS